MPAFNPQVPEADPTRTQDFMNFSRSISPYELRASADKSKGIALTGLGKALEEGISAYGAVKEQSIKDEAYQKLQPIIDDTTAALEGAIQTKQEGQTQAKPQEQGSTDQGSTDVIPTASKEPSGENAPASVQAGLNKIGYLTGVGKLKPDLQTHLSGQVAAVQKEMRAENPGFISLIDREVSKITGGIDANSHLRNLMTQIASADQTRQGYQKEVVNKLLSVTQEGAGPEFATYAAGVMNGSISVEEGMKYLGTANRKLFKNKEAESDLNLSIKRGEDASRQAEVHISSRANDFFNGIFHATVTGGGQINNESIEAYLQDVAEGRAKIDPIQLNKLADTLEARKAQGLIELRRQLTAHAPGQVSTYDALHNPEKFDKLLTDASDEFTKNIQLIRSGNGLGLAHALARNNQDFVTRAENQIYNDPKIGPMAQQIPAMQKIFGNTKQFQDMIDKYLVNPKVAPLFQGWFQDAATSMLSSNGKIPMSTVIDNGMRIGQTPSGKAAGQQEMARTYNEVLKLGDYLEKGDNANMKGYLARSMYLPNNYNLIDKFDSKDQVDVFNKFVSKGKVDAITSLNDPKLAKAQKDWGEVSFFKVYKTELGDLKDILQGKENLLHASWDTTTNHWKVELAQDPQLNPLQRGIRKLFNPPSEGFGFEPGLPPTSALGTFIQEKVSGYDRIQESIGRINTALDSMNYMEKARGGSVNGFMLDVMNALGANPSKADSPDATVEDKMARAIMTGRKPPEQPKASEQPKGGAAQAQPVQKMNYMGEETKQPRSLKDWINNPAARQKAEDDLLKKASDSTASLENQGVKLNPKFEKGLASAIEDYKAETGREVRISSLVRNRAQQARAYMNYLHGGGGLAAPPGHSRHEIGEAADLNTDIAFRNWLHHGNRISKYDMEFLSGSAGEVDPNHIQLSRRSREANK